MTHAQLRAAIAAECRTAGELARYKIEEGADHYHGTAIYRVVGRRNDYVGEWTENKSDAIDERERLEGWGK
jgi:hypothetical protein